MSHEHAPSQEQDAGLFGKLATRSFIHEPVHDNPCPANTTGCDPKSPSHAELWAHQLDGINIAEDNVVGPALGGPVINNYAPTDRAWKKNLMGTAGLGFEVGDFVLEHGGQVALDIAGFVPGLNIATELAQSAYHGAHAAYDSAEGNAEGAKREAIETAWHLGSTAANAFTLEGGNLAHAAHEASRAKAIVHGAHTIVDAHEASWDLAASIVDDEKKLPMFPGIVPWIAGGAGRNGGNE